jgi:hypothetical protein
MAKTKRHAYLLIVCFIGGLFFFVASSAICQENKGFVSDPGFNERLRPPVRFLHDDHNEAAGLHDCAACHHLYEDGKKVEGDMSVGMACSECHLSGTSDTELDLIRAYHLQCRGCHIREKAGPVTCGQCHGK